MNASTAQARRGFRRKTPRVAGKRILITGAARGIGAALARQLHHHGARVALLGIEESLLAQVAADCGDAPWRYCDIGDPAQVQRVVNSLTAELGGLDAVVCNAGIARQLSLLGGDPTVLEETLAVNVLGVYYTQQNEEARLNAPGQRSPRMPESATQRQRSASPRLPRGRHGLPREEVVAAQRDRILLAMAEAMTENGYVGTPVAAVIKRAGVSRETFYEQFRSKEDCFEAAYERAAELMLSGILAATGAEFDGETRTERIERVLGAYLDALAGQPAYARLFLVEVYAVGPEAIARRTALQETFVAMVADVLGADTEPQRFACQTLVAALSAMVTARIAVGDLAGLRELREPLLELVRRSGDLFGSTVFGD